MVCQNRRLAVWLVTLTVSLGTLTACGDHRDDRRASTTPSAFDQFVQETLAQTRVVGMSYLVINGGRTVEEGAYGWADRETARKARSSSIYQIASVSKTVTGTIVMQLVEHGRLDLDMDVSRYLPFTVKHPRFPGEAITLRMLLSHTSGIADNDGLYMSLYTIESGGGDSQTSLQEFAAAYFSEGGIWYDADKNFTSAAPGTEFHYSNTAYGLLGYVVENVTGIAFHEYSRRNVFDRIDMNDSSWLFSETDMSRFAIPYLLGETALPPYSFPTYPDGALKTTVDDYGKFIRALMDSAHGRRTPLLSQASLGAMLEPQAADRQQGLTWRYQPLAELGAEVGLDDLLPDTVGHTGGDPGIVTFALWNPRTQGAVILFANSNPALDATALKVIEVLKRAITIANL